MPTKIDDELTIWEKNNVEFMEGVQRLITRFNKGLTKLRKDFDTKEAQEYKRIANKKLKHFKIELRGPREAIVFRNNTNECVCIDDLEGPQELEMDTFVLGRMIQNNYYSIKDLKQLIKEIEEDFPIKGNKNEFLNIGE